MIRLPLGFEAASGMKVEFLLISPIRLSTFSLKTLLHP